MRFPLPGTVLLLVLLPFHSGCQNPRAARIQAHAESFAASDAFSQRLIQEGRVDLGFTREQVFMALGKANQATRQESPEGVRESLTFKNIMVDDAAMVKFGASTPADRGPGRMGANPTQGAGRNTAAVSRPGEPTIDQMATPALATLHLDLLNGRVVNLRVEN